MSMKPKFSKGSGKAASQEIGIMTKAYKGGGKSQRTSKVKVVDPKSKC